MKVENSQLISPLILQMKQVSNKFIINNIKNITKIKLQQFKLDKIKKQIVKNLLKKIIII